MISHLWSRHARKAYRRDSLCQPALSDAIQTSWQPGIAPLDTWLGQCVKRRWRLWGITFMLGVVFAQPLVREGWRSSEAVPWAVLLI
jgi:hypothetical protein